jgi:type I restriction enzyme, S subunit
MVKKKIKKGYKQSELGIIPDDWNIENINCLSKNLLSGGTPSTTNSEFWNGDIPWTRGAVLTQHYIDNAEKLISKKGLKHSSSVIIPKHNILIASRVSVGNISINKIDIAINQDITGIIVKKEKILVEYFYWNLAYFIKKFVTFSQGTSIQGFKRKELKKFKISFPSLPEQEKISNLLSDIDKLIQKLDYLIEKKRNIKQGTVQELLTGKRRLGEFNEEWEIKKLGELLDYEQPTKYLVSNTNYNDNFNIPVLTAGKTFVLGCTNEKTGIFQNIPVIIFDDFTTATKFVTFPFKAKSSAMKILKAKNVEINLEYIFEMMQIIDFSVRDHKRYWLSEYQFLELKIPKIDEQNSIMEILSDMKLEISQLEKQRDKYIMIKNAMMQKLLTGEIRIK